MKSKEDMQKVVVALTMATHGKLGPELNADETSRARAVMDVLLWVMNYPNNFHAFAEPTISMVPLEGAKLDKMFDEAVKYYELDKDKEGTVTE